MISLRKCLEELNGSEAYAALMRVLVLILDTVAAHAVRYDGAKLGEFQEALHALSRELADDEQSSDQLFITAGRTASVIEAYNSKATHELTSQRRELQGMVVLLTSAVTRVFHATDHSLASLKSIQEQLERTTQLDDLRVVKSRLQDCLGAVQAEFERQKVHAEDTRETLEKARTSHIVQQAVDQSGKDIVTGLPGRAQALELLEGIAAAGSHCYAVPVRIETLSLVKNRFGAEVSNQVAALVSQALVKSFTDEDRLFRWSDCAMLAVLQRGEPPEATRVDLRRRLSPRIVHTVMIGPRSVLLTIPLSWASISTWESPDAETLSARIDQFLSTPASKR